MKQGNFLSAILLGAMVMALAVSGCATTSAEKHTYKYTTEVAPGVVTPDKLDSSIGTLHLTDGFPNPDTESRR